MQPLGCHTHYNELHGLVFANMKDGVFEHDSIVQQLVDGTGCTNQRDVGAMPDTETLPT